MTPVRINGLAFQSSYCHGSTLRPQVSGFNSTRSLSFKVNPAPNCTPEPYFTIVLFL